MSSWHLAKVVLHVLSIGFFGQNWSDELHILCLLWHYLALNAMETGKAVYEVFI